MLLSPQNGAELDSAGWSSYTWKILSSTFYKINIKKQYWQREKPSFAIMTEMKVLATKWDPGLPTKQNPSCC